MTDVVITEFMDEAAVAYLAEHFLTRYDPSLADRAVELVELAASARALVVRNRTQVRGGLLEAAARLECVGRLGVGLDNIDLDACEARGIAVYPATGANDRSVAEYVVAAALILIRRAFLATSDVAAGRWPREALIGGELSGKVLGLVGYGAIARETAARAAALGMDVAAHDPFVPADDSAWGKVRRTGLAQLFAEADVVSLHVPLTDDTRHMIGAAAFAAMKPGAILINAARGGIVDEAALRAALAGGQLGGAALDVFEGEPLSADAGRAFAGLTNLILTPHIAGVTVESNARVSAVTAENVIRHLERTR